MKSYEVHHSHRGRDHLELDGNFTVNACLIPRLRATRFCLGPELIRDEVGVPVVVTEVMALGFLHAPCLVPWLVAQIGNADEARSISVPDDILRMSVCHPAQ